MASSRIEQFRKIVSDRSMGDVDGQPMDLFTAGICVTVYEHLSEGSRELFETQPLQFVVRACQHAYRKASALRR